VLYFRLEPPIGGFDALQAAATYLFVDAWHPSPSAGSQIRRLAGRELSLLRVSQPDTHIRAWLSRKVCLQ
jgi:hypothetical protein